jgi:hypothetical protein
MFFSVNWVYLLCFQPNLSSGYEIVVAKKVYGGICKKSGGGFFYRGLYHIKKNFFSNIG